MEYGEFATWVSKELKIDLIAYKESQVERRLRSLLARRNLKDFQSLKEIVSCSLKEKEELLEFITINVTEFFRNPQLFDEFRDVVNDIIKEKPRRLKIWSAACSIGCEPYTIAMILAELNQGLKHDILATDINKSILIKAKNGEYTPIDIKNVDDKYKDKYFYKENGSYIVQDKIKSYVRFNRHDLIKDTYESDFDIIVCRNVVIYFKDEIKNKVFIQFAEALKPGGLLFIGATESIYNYKQFGLEKVATFIYRKI